MAMGAGIREVLVYAETAQKPVTVTAGTVTVSGQVCSVNPLIIHDGGGSCAHVLNADMVTSVSIDGITGATLTAEIRPKGESRFGVKAS